MPNASTIILEIPTFWFTKENLKLGLKLWKEFKRIPHKYDYICVGFLLTPFPTSHRYATVTSTKNDLQC